MALSAGTVTIDSAGAATGTGLAKAIYDELIGTITFPSGISAATTTRAKQSVASTAQAFATGIVEHITANAAVSVSVTTADVGLQTLPNPVVAGAATTGPTETKTLTGTVT